MDGRVNWWADALAIVGTSTTETAIHYLYSFSFSPMPYLAAATVLYVQLWWRWRPVYMQQTVS